MLNTFLSAGFISLFAKTCKSCFPFWMFDYSLCCRTEIKIDFSGECLITHSVTESNITLSLQGKKSCFPFTAK